MKIRFALAAASVLAAALFAFSASGTPISGYTADNASAGCPTLVRQGRLRGLDRRSVRHPAGLRRPAPDLRRFGPDGEKGRAGDADRPARPGRGDGRSVPGRDGQEPRAPAHDPVQQRAHARGPLVRRQRACRHLRCRGAQAAELLRDDGGQHRDAAGARGVPRAGRLVHPGRQPERQAARAHRHQLRDQHLRPQSRRHARPADLHDAERAAVRGPDLRPINWPICPIVDSSSRYGFVTLRGGGLFVVDATGHADGHRRRVRQGDGERKRLRRRRGAGPHVHQLGRQPGERLVRRSPPSRRSTGSTSTGSRSPATPPSNPANTPAPELLFSKGGMSDSHGIAPTNAGSLPLGHGSARQRRRDHRRRVGPAGEHGQPGRPAQRRSRARPGRPRTGRRPALRRAARAGAARAAIRTTPPGARPASASFR